MGRSWGLKSYFYRYKLRELWISLWKLLCNQRRNKKALYFLVIILIPVIDSYLDIHCRIFGVFCAKSSSDLAKEYITTAKNYQKYNEIEKMLEYSLRAYEEDKNKPDVIYYVVYSYLLKCGIEEYDNKANGVIESYNKARDILISNSEKLGVNERALFGIVESKLSNYNHSFKLLSEIDLLEVKDEILPDVLILFADSAFNSQSYKEALFYLQDILSVVDTKVKYYGPRAPVIAYTDSLKYSINPTWYIRFLSTKLAIGYIWFLHAYKTKQMNHWTEALKVANQGFMIIRFSVNTKKTILQYLSLVNEVLKNEEFVNNNRNLVVESIGKVYKHLNRTPFICDRGT